MANINLTTGRMVNFGRGIDRTDRKKPKNNVDNVTSNTTRYGVHGPSYETDWDRMQNQILKEKREAKATLARQKKAQELKQRPPKKKVKPASWDKMKMDRPKTSLTPEEYFKKIR